jgi:hypothetical protein
MDMEVAPRLRIGKIFELLAGWRRHALGWANRVKYGPL